MPWKAAYDTQFCEFNIRKAVLKLAKNFRDCANHYLKQWSEQDREFFLGFSGGQVTCELLDRMCVKYQVARTVPGHGPDKYRQFAEMLNRYRNTEMTRQNVPEIIEEELRKMRNVYGGKSFLSAISKAFWMMKRHPVVIYDKNVRKGLRHYGLPPGENNYDAYFDSWFRFFERDDTKRRVQDALAWLRAWRNAPKRPRISADELEELAGSEWFANRVVDMHLFHTAI